MSNLIGVRVTVYPPEDCVDNEPYDAIVKTVKILADGTHQIVEVYPIGQKDKVKKVADQIVTFVSSPFGKQVFDWLARLFDFKGRKQRRKSQAPRF